MLLLLLLLLLLLFLVYLPRLRGMLLRVFGDVIKLLPSRSEIDEPWRRALLKLREVSFLGGKLYSSAVGVGIQRREMGKVEG